MRRRVIAAIVATLLALIGATLIAAYVASADARALAKLEPTPVLVVTTEIPTGGTLVVGENAEVREIPLVAVVPGALAAADPVADLVAAGSIVPGEQLVPQRFTTRENLSGDVVEIPPELVQVTLLLPPERVLGGKLVAGDTVGIVLSVSPDVGPYWSQTILHRALVGRVQAAEQVTTGEQQKEDAAAPPPGAQYITLAISSADAERVVWGAEHGTLWLTLERVGSTVDGTKRVDVENVGS